MKNTKNTRVQKQQKKAKKQRRISSTLMCGLVLSSVALPAVAVLADNAVQNQAPQTAQSSTKSSEATKVETPTSASEAVKTVQDTPAPQAKSAQGTITVDVINGKDSSVIKSHTFTGTVGDKLTWGQIFETIDTTGWSLTGDKYIDGADGQMGYILFQDIPRTVYRYTNNQATEKHKAIIHFVNSVTGKPIKADMTVEGTTDQDIRTVAGQDAFEVAGYTYTEEPSQGYSFNDKWVQEYTAFFTPEGYVPDDDGFVLGTDGYYHQKRENGDINYNTRFADFNITYTNKDTGEVLGTDAQGIQDADAGAYSNTAGYGYRAVAKGDSKWIDRNSSIDNNGKRYYTSIHVYTDRSGDGSQGDVVLSPVNGQINVTVPITDLTKTVPAENVTFKIRYVDDATGKDIAPAETETLPVGSSYSSVALDIPHYKINGDTIYNYTVQKGQKDLIYRYTKDQESFVEFKLVDAKTNKEIGKSVKRSGQDGQWTSIDPTSKEFKIDGYTMQKSFYQTPGLGTQTYDFSEPGKTNSVTVKYDKDSDKPNVKDGKLTIRYTDTLGNEIKDSKTQTGKVGDLYEVVAPDIKGWKLNDNSSNLYRDDYTEGNTTVTFKYDKDETVTPAEQGSVTVQYLDQDGKAIKEAKTLKGDVDKAFSEKAPTIKGYKLTSDKTVSGKFTDKTQTVKFTYKKDTPTPDPVKQGSVTFKYVDKDSKELQAPKTFKGEVDKALEEKAPSIKGYKLDTTKSEETYKGKYTELGQTYYFVYVGDDSTPSNKDNNNTSDNSTQSDNKDSNNESGKTVPPTAPKGSYYDDNGNLLNKDGVLIDSKGTPLTSDQSKNTLKVDNTKNKTGLPETGESSTLLMMLSGLGVLMASVLAFIVKRKPKRD